MKTFDYFNKPGRPHADNRIELWCGNYREARRVHWDDLDDLLNRILEMSDTWGGGKERKAWKSWVHNVVLASTALRTLAHRPEGFVDLPDAPDGTKWMMYINPYVEKKESGDEH